MFMLDRGNILSCVDTSFLYELSQWQYLRVCHVRRHLLLTERDFGRSAISANILPLCYSVRTEYYNTGRLRCRQHGIELMR